MPYIKKEERSKFDKILTEIEEVLKKTETTQQDGELNYLFTKVLHKIYTPSYFNYNRALGLLEGIKLEFYRRKVAFYEDQKVAINGDV